MIVELDFQRRAPLAVGQQAVQRAAHRGVGERIGDAAMRDPLRVEMAVAVDIDRHGAAAVAARDHLEAEEARELELLPERPPRTPLTNARADRKSTRLKSNNSCA